MNALINVAVETIPVIIPAAVANCAPVIAAYYKWLPALNSPLDGQRRWRDRPVFGSHKTWRGLIFGILFGSIAGFFVSSPLTGALVGLGALAGDAAKSFCKRQLGIAPGTMWPPFDQIDAAVGAMIVASFIFPLSLAHWLFVIVTFGIGSYATSIIGTQLKIKKSL